MPLFFCKILTKTYCLLAVNFVFANSLDPDHDARSDLGPSCSIPDVIPEFKDNISKVEKYLQAQTLTSMQRVSPLMFSVNVTFVIVSTEDISDNEKMDFIENTDQLKFFEFGKAFSL